MQVEIPDELADQLRSAFWGDELFDAVDDRVNVEMEAARPGAHERFVWATVGALNDVARKLHAAVLDHDRGGL